MERGKQAPLVVSTPLDQTEGYRVSCHLLCCLAPWTSSRTTGPEPPRPKGSHGAQGVDAETGVGVTVTVLYTHDAT